jgi:sugar phosphate isomerase/epimerase
LVEARRLGLDGVFFRSVLDISPSLDSRELRAVRAEADRLGMFLEAGLGKVNPFATAEDPELRAIGEGDIRSGFVRMMRACAEIECRDLWVSLANKKPQFRGRHAYDRYRTDVTWPEQLDATARFLAQLAPTAVELEIHLNVETHEEITSFEAVRLVENVGGDAMGIVFDSSNMLQRGEHPTFACRRVAPYTRQTHLKDARLTRTPDGVVYDVVPCGAGVVDFPSIVSTLLAIRPSIHLTIENRPPETGAASARPTLIEIDAPEWWEEHPDVEEDERVAFRSLIDAVAAPTPAPRTYPFGKSDSLAGLEASVTHLREAVAELLPEPVASRSDLS